MASNFAGMSSAIEANSTKDYMEYPEGTFDYLLSAEDSSENEEKMASSEIAGAEMRTGATTTDTVALMESKILQRVASMSISTWMSPRPVAEVSFTEEDDPRTALGGGQNQNCMAPPAAAMTGGINPQGIRTTPLGKRKHHARGQAVMSSPHQTQAHRETVDAATPRASNAKTACSSVGGPFPKKRRGLLDTAPLFPLEEVQQEEENKEYYSPYEQRLERLASMLPRRPSRSGRLQLYQEEAMADSDVPSLTNSLAASPTLSSTNTSASTSPVPFGILLSTDASSLLSVSGTKSTTRSSERASTANNFQSKASTDDDESTTTTAALERPACWKTPQHRHGRRRRQFLKMRRSGSRNKTTRPAPSFPWLMSPLEVSHESPFHNCDDDDGDEEETPLQVLARNMASSSSASTNFPNFSPL